ncbi:MAG: ribosome biogenesis GTPase Der [Patescibacteria group bacterium]
MALSYKVAICGRINVGKSTLFNRLISSPKAIVSAIAGTTRDRNYADCEWDKTSFQLIDTGGFVAKTNNIIDQKINQQADTAAKEADLLLFVVDTRAGLVPEDKQIARMLSNYKKPIILVANKADNLRWRQQTANFYQLGLGDPHPVSAINGSGSGDLLDAIVNILQKTKKRIKTKTPEQRVIKVAIVGQPNVGKSSLVNSLVGQERLIVSHLPHTTRDAQDISLVYHGQNIILIDTAGLRRKTKKAVDPFEKQSVAQSVMTLKKSDITILVTDVTKPLTWQDKNLLQETVNAGKGVIILANKWDLIPDKKTDTIKKYDDYYHSFFPFVTWAPLLYTSALDKTRLAKILPLIMAIWQEKNRVIDANALDKLLKKIVKKHKPAKGKGTKQPYIYSLKQTGTNPPRFEIKIDFKSELHHSYLRFIENNLRYKFGFNGVPIKIHIAKTQNATDKTK